MKGWTEEAVQIVETVEVVEIVKVESTRLRPFDKLRAAADRME
jgi:hypothetical protein